MTSEVLHVSEEVGRIVDQQIQARPSFARYLSGTHPLDMPIVPLAQLVCIVPEVPVGERSGWDMKQFWQDVSVGRRGYPLLAGIVEGPVDCSHQKVFSSQPLLPTRSPC